MCEKKVKENFTYNEPIFYQIPGITINGGAYTYTIDDDDQVTRMKNNEQNTFGMITASASTPNSIITVVNKKPIIIITALLNDDSSLGETGVVYGDLMVGKGNSGVTVDASGRVTVKSGSFPDALAAGGR